MTGTHGNSRNQNTKAHLANAYNELGKELSSSKVKVVGNYTLGKVIGEGAYGKVRMGTHRLTGVRVAIKQIPKSVSSSLTREIHHHRQLHHPHVAQMYEVIATESSVWIVTELCSGGELFDYLVEKGRLEEIETKIVFGQLCLAVAYLHEKGIVHRDLKLENVLLDERCRVKLGDFGFTREFERGGLMETFCGTTGYASPEMLQGRKYNGPEVDVWSLGVILYCLLTGGLPFDDDDEQVMRDKIILGEFEDPLWLSSDARSLIRGVLEQDTAQRLTIPQILSHPWFARSNPPTQSSDFPLLNRARSPLFEQPLELPSFGEASVPSSSQGHQSSENSSRSDSIPHSSAPTTPDDDDDLFQARYVAQRYKLGNPSESTLRKSSDFESHSRKQPETVVEEESDTVEPLRSSIDQDRPPRPNSSASTQAPPIHTLRTPARTKRRSVSSALSLSVPSSPSEKTPTFPIPPTAENENIDFTNLLNTQTKAPIIFSTPMERQLLNALSLLGFDLGQIVYSVLNDACDAASAVWWMMLKKSERKSLGLDDDSPDSAGVASPVDTLIPLPDLLQETPTKPRPSTHSKKHSLAYSKTESGKRHISMGVQTESQLTSMQIALARSAPSLGIVPPTPTFTSTRPSTPPRGTNSPTPLLTPSSSLLDAASASKSHPSTPSKDKDRDGMGSKGRKTRSGSVSIMQRATTALEAAGLVRKKSTEAMKDEREREKSREAERKNSGPWEDPRNSYASTSSKLTKSPPLKPTKGPGPSTPPPSELHHPHPQVIHGSPWVMAESREELSLFGSTHSIAPTPANSPGLDGLPVSLSSPNFGAPDTGSRGKGGQNRNKANLLTAFRLWFNEERKGKRKENNSSNGGSRFIPSSNKRAGNSPGGPMSAYPSNTSKRNNNGRQYRTSNRHKRQSVSSRRSSSVNSRRSSITSIQMVMMDSPPPVTGRRSFGSHTPNSEGYHDGSRPSSIRSFSMHTGRHRKSPSASSIGSAHFRTASPMHSKYHRRAGSGGSTRVVRKIHTSRPPHHRSNSAASSIPSPGSSRPTSFIEYSDTEIMASPLKSRSRRGDRYGSGEDSATPRRGNTAFIASRRIGPFASPGGYGGSMGKSSWKKSWGLEPPGWQTRTAHLPVEVLVMSPPTDGSASIRDVFSGRQSLTMGDEDDWVDEDDEIPYAPGLGQLVLSAGASTSSSSQGQQPTRIESTVTLSPAPRGNRFSKRNKGASNSQTQSVSAGRQKTPSPVPAEAPYESNENTARGGRRQIPPNRSGPQPIQEEDEEEE